MKRYPALSAAEIEARLSVNVETGECHWRDATKYHRRLVGTLAGHARAHHHGKKYWVIKINGIPYKRAQLVLAISTGRWPDEMVDHIDGNSLNDRSTNLRHATGQQNAQNHKGRAKRSTTPMGVRITPQGKFQARITCDKKIVYLGVYSTPEQASEKYQAARKEYFHAFS